MISKNFFKRAKNELEGVIRPQKSENEREKNQEKGKTGGFGEAAEELWTSCASCKALILTICMSVLNAAITTGSRHGRELRFLRIVILLRSATEI